MPEVTLWEGRVSGAGKAPLLASEEGRLARPSFRGHAAPLSHGRQRLQGSRPLALWLGWARQLREVSRRSDADSSSGTLLGYPLRLHPPRVRGKLGGDGVGYAVGKLGLPCRPSIGPQVSKAEGASLQMPFPLRSLAGGGEKRLKLPDLPILLPPAAFALDRAAFEMLLWETLQGLSQQFADICVKDGDDVPSSRFRLLATTSIFSLAVCP